MTGQAPDSAAAPPSVEADRIFRDQLVALIPALRTFARGLCGTRDLADDMAQDAMLRGWAARSSFIPGTNFRAWMFMILRNQFYTTIRKSRRTVSLEPELAERMLVEAPPQQHQIHLADVSRALLQLLPEQREVLLLIGANGLSYDEAAEVVGCAIGTIKSRLARGRKALTQLIDGPTGDSPLDQAA